MRIIVLLLACVLTASAQDTACSALNLNGRGDFTGDTSVLSASGLPLSCGVSASAPDAWYRIQPVNAGTISLETCGSSTTAPLTLVSYQASSCSSLTMMECRSSASGCTPGSQTLRLPVAMGGDYYVRVCRTDGTGGPFTLNVQDPAGVFGCPAVALGANGAGFGLPSCSTVNIPSGPTFFRIDLLAGLPGAPIILAAASGCTPRAIPLSPCYSFDLDYSSLLWLVDGTGTGLTGASNLLSQYAVTSSAGTYAIGTSLDVSPGPWLSFQAAVIDPTSINGIRMSQALGTDAL